MARAQTRPAVSPDQGLRDGVQRSRVPGLGRRKSLPARLIEDSRIIEARARFREAILAPQPVSILVAGRAHLSLSNLPLEERHLGVTLCHIRGPLYRLRFRPRRICPECLEHERG